MYPVISSLEVLERQTLHMRRLIEVLNVLGKVPHGLVSTAKGYYLQRKA